MALPLSKKEAAQLKETVRLFETITYSQPDDYQSLEILKEAYYQLGQPTDAVRTAKRIAGAYLRLNWLADAVEEYEAILKIDPDDAESKKVIADLKPRLPVGTEVKESRKEAKRSAEDEAILKEMEDMIAKVEAQAALEAEANSWDSRDIYAVPADLRWLCGISVTILTWGLPGRGWLLGRWRNYFKENEYTLRWELALAIQEKGKIALRVFALEMLLAVPRVGEKALRDVLPLNAGKPDEEDDHIHGLRCRGHFMDSWGPEGAKYVGYFTGFAQEFRAAVVEHSPR